MFGFLKPRCGDIAYRQIYAKFCAGFHETFGRITSPLLSYEANFLYALAIETGICGGPGNSAPKCCRLRRDSQHRSEKELRILQYCGAVGLLLVDVKLEDDIRDSRSLRARLAKWLLRNKLTQSRGILDSVGPTLRSRISDQIETHIALERAAGQVPLEIYAQPTAAAFGEIFAVFGEAFTGKHEVGNVKGELNQERRLDWRLVGSLLGRGILLADVLFDWREDQRSRNFTPLRNREMAEQCKILATKSFADAMAACQSLSDDSVVLRTLDIAFQRIARFEILESPSRHKTRLGDYRLPIGRRAAAARAGICDCDCGCDCCCNGCDGGDGAWCQACSVFDCACIPCDCCCWRRDGDRTSRRH